MSTHSFTALIPVTATGKNEADAREYARGLLDDHLARLDAELPLGNLSTGPVTLVDPANLRRLLTLIRDDANAALDGEIGHITALRSTARTAGKLLDALRAAPAQDTTDTSAGSAV